MPTLQAAQVVDGEGAIAGRREAVDAEERQVDLAVAGDETVGADESAGVEERSRPAASSMPTAAKTSRRRQSSRQRGRHGAGQRFGVGGGLGEAVEAVTGQGTLGEYDKPGAAPGRVGEAGADDSKVRGLVGKAAVHLHAGDFPGGHKCLPYPEGVVYLKPRVAQRTLGDL